MASPVVSLAHEKVSGCHHRYHPKEPLPIKMSKPLVPPESDPWYQLWKRCSLPRSLQYRSLFRHIRRKPWRYTEVCRWTANVSSVSGFPNPQSLFPHSIHRWVLKLSIGVADRCRTLRQRNAAIGLVSLNRIHNRALFPMLTEVDHSFDTPLSSVTDTLQVTSSSGLAQSHRSKVLPRNIL